MSLPRKILETQNAHLLRMGMNALRAIVKRIGRMRFLLQHHPWTNAKNTDLRWLPVNSDIALP